MDQNVQIIKSDNPCPALTLNQRLSTRWGVILRNLIDLRGNLQKFCLQNFYIFNVPNYIYYFQLFPILLWSPWTNMLYGRFRKNMILHQFWFAALASNVSMSRSCFSLRPPITTLRLTNSEYAKIPPRGKYLFERWKIKINSVCLIHWYLCW